MGDGYRILFMQGGASTQFGLIPMNFLPAGATADYLLTGVWSEKASEDAAKIGAVHIAASTQAEQYRRIPAQSEIRLSAQPAYVHLTTNNTIYGTQWHTLPDVGDAPLIADMSSDILSRPLDAERFAMIYGGAQKNLGPAGVTVVAVREAWLEQAPKSLPAMLRYATHAKNSSLYNTPPVFAIYMLNLVLGWITAQGLDTLAAHNQRKAAEIYGAIDESNGFYRGHAAADSRSLMNITFRLPSEELEKQFVSAATAEGMVGLAGHRSVGGIRASVYNAQTLEACTALAQFMADFAHKA